MLVATGVTRLDIGEWTIEVVRKNIKDLHVAVYPPHGHVRIATVPLRTTDDAVRIFAIARIPLIRRQPGKFPRQERQPPRQFISGESHNVVGQRNRLQVISAAHQRAELKMWLATLRARRQHD